MLATRIRQKDGIFYFVSLKAADILHRVRFTSRFYFEGETIEADADADDPIAKFIGKVEKSEKAFQRLLSRKKGREIVNFYESAQTQPAIPGSVLLFAEEVLKYRQEALRGRFIAAAIQDQPPGRPQQAGEMDPSGRALQRNQEARGAERKTFHEGFSRQAGSRLRAHRRLFEGCAHGHGKDLGR